MIIVLIDMALESRVLIPNRNNPAQPEHSPLHCHLLGSLSSYSSFLRQK